MFGRALRCYLKDFVATWHSFLHLFLLHTIRYRTGQVHTVHCVGHPGDTQARDRSRGSGGGGPFPPHSGR
jgi:hypothetical protein